jgi:hypothetical protein
MGELLGRMALRDMAVLLVAVLLAALPAEAQEGKKGKKAPPAKAAPAAPKAAPLTPTEGAPKAEADAPAEEPAAAGGAAKAAPPSADFWILDFGFKKVGTVQPTEGVHRGDVYWYLLYRVENKTGQDREVYVSVSARSNKEKSYADVYLPDVEPLVEKKVGKPLWGKVDAFQDLKDRIDKGDTGKGDAGEKKALGYSRFRAGEQRDCVAIFNRLDPGATQIAITVDGLSNDFHIVDREGGKRDIQSRIYVIELERPGDEYAMNLDRFRVVKQGWSKKLTPLAVPKEG